MGSNYYELMQLLPGLPARRQEAIERLQQEVLPMRQEGAYKDEGLRLLADLRAGVRTASIGEEIRQWFERSPHRPGRPPKSYPTPGQPV